MSRCWVCGRFAKVVDWGGRYSAWWHYPTKHRLTTATARINWR